MNTTGPTVEQVLESMQARMESVPDAVDKAAWVDPAMVREQAHGSAFAMPADDGALSPETRILVYLAAALATSNHACTKAMANKAKVQGIADEKLLEAFHIARFALATRVVGNAEPLFDMLTARRR